MFNRQEDLRFTAVLDDFGGERGTGNGWNASSDIDPDFDFGTNSVFSEPADWRGARGEGLNPGSASGSLSESIFWRRANGQRRRVGKVAVASHREFV